MGAFFKMAAGTYKAFIKIITIIITIFLKFLDYKKKIGFTGQLLIEPKPKEPTKHQYDYGLYTFSRIIIIMSVILTFCHF